MLAVADILLSVFLVVGALFGLIGSFGLLKLKDPMQRLHAPTKATTVGVGTALVASILNQWVFAGDFTWQEFLIVVFLFLTAPVTANFLGKVHLHLIIRREDLPPTGRTRPWATLEGNTPPEPPPAPDRANI